VYMDIQREVIDIQGLAVIVDPLHAAFTLLPARAALIESPPMKEEPPSNSTVLRIVAHCLEALSLSFPDNETKQHDFNLEALKQLNLREGGCVELEYSDGVRMNGNLHCEAFPFQCCLLQHCLESLSLSFS